MSAPVVLGALLVAALVPLGVAKVLALPAMRARAEHVGFSPDAYRWIGALELSAAVGICLGGVLPALAVAAAAGVVALLAGACIAHLRAGDRWPALLPAVVVAALAVGFVVSLVGSS